MLIITIILTLVIIIFPYLIVLGASMYKTDEEKQIEDEEQSKYLKNGNKQ